MGLRDLFSLDTRVAIVTGGSRGLGLKLAEGLGEMGAQLVITARHPEQLDAAAEQLRSSGFSVLPVSCDLSEEAESARLVDVVMKHFGKIDILINNAARGWAAPAEDHPTHGWRKVMALNVDGAFFLTREVGTRSMIPNRSGKIINVASTGGLGGNPPEQTAYTVAYNTSKGALVNFTRALAVEWGKYNINVNALCPGFFESDLSRGLLARIEEQLLSTTPLRRLPNLEDFKGIAALLASEASRHITGQVIAVDGGLTAY